MPQDLKKKSFFTTITKMVKKVFTLFRYLIHFVWELIENAQHLIFFFFSYLIRFIASPTTPCVVAIIAFIGVSLVAAYQWFLIGLWLGSKLGVTGLAGFGAGFCGILLGVGINIYQLAPELWKLRREIAEAYQQLKINPDHEHIDESVQSRTQNWLSVGHIFLKNTRLISYGIEAALVLSYVFFTGLNFFGIIQAGISLLLPEKVLGLVSATISVLGKVSDHINNQESDHVHL